jgi:hypothetical protein
MKQPPLDPVHHDATLALRASSPVILLQKLAKFAADCEYDDDRDIMIRLAPYHECAARLGVDPSEVFDAASRESPRLAGLIQTFGRRRDITLEAFGWRLADSASGPFYIRSDDNIGMSTGPFEWLDALLDGGQDETRIE